MNTQHNKEPRQTVPHIPIWYTGLASSMCPKCPGQSLMPSPQLRHFMERSTVPRRGSNKPPGFGRPFSYVSGCSIRATDIAFYVHPSQTYTHTRAQVRNDQSEIPTYGFFRGHDPKLDILDFLDWCRRMLKVRYHR